MKWLHPHPGYALRGGKRALLQADAAFSGGRFEVIDADRRIVLFEGPLHALGPVLRWRDWHFWEADFSALATPGEAFLSLAGAQPPLVSHRFALAESPLGLQQLSNLLHYFKGQRCSGIFDEADRACPVFGDEQQRRDVHGGWYDASGDCSKYLSHLSYANVLNPQQTPQLVWNLIDARAQLPAQPLWFDERIVDEALHGAAWLLRMQHESGFFHATVFDRWSKDVGQRRLCSYSTQQGHLSPQCQAAFRQGGGSAIAALARASTLPRDGEGITRAAALAAARRGFAHLQAHNRDYLPDGRENIIDDYGALLAACELWAATWEPFYAQAAERRAASLLARQHAEGWFWVDDERTRSFVHAAEAGLPCIALMRLLEVRPEHAPGPVRDAVRRACVHQLELARAGAGNPFAYPRQMVRVPGQAPVLRFFMPHDNDSGYWWQGENARLGSLAAAALRAARHLPDEAALCASLRAHAQACLDWIFGFNPFDACMMQGEGHHAPRYEPGYWNAPSGVCNGITAGALDEDDIDFKRPDETDITQSWRWSEQWLPHGAWLFLALASLLSS
jgi:hypothetical protein